jgi:hypothetical protein
MAEQDKRPPYKLIATGLQGGEIIPFFGAAASAVYRPERERWEPGKPFMPFGGELATTLATAAEYPVTDTAFKLALSDILTAIKNVINVSPQQAEDILAPVLRKHVGGPPDLALVASWAEHVQSKRWYLDQTLREGFVVDCKPGLLHAKLAAIEGTRLFVTTNYDDLLETALAPRRPYLIVDRGDKGLWAGPAGGTLERVSSTGTELNELLNDPNTQQPLRPIVFKMHGSVDKVDARNDHYLITEEDYVDFLGRSGGNYVPPYINGLMEGKDFLFLGYSLEDWNVRVILRKLIKRRAVAAVRFWAIVRGRSDVEQEVWKTQNLSIHPMDLQLFAQELSKWLP